MRIPGIAHALPSKIVTNNDVLENLAEGSRAYLSARELDRVLTLTESSFSSAGTKVRYHLAAGEKPYELCLAACRSALEQAQVEPDQVDLLIYVGIGRGFLEPATANVFQDLLGLKNATCFDVLDACASWLRAFELIHALMRTGKYKTALIMNGEFIGRYAYRYALKSVEEFEHWFPGVTVGEAATATVLRIDDEPCDFQISFRNYGNKRDLCLIPMANYADYLGPADHHGDGLTSMEFFSLGGKLLHFGARKLIDHFTDLEGETHLPYDIVLGHAASDRVCEHIGRRCGLDFEKFQFTHKLFGNTVSASLPLALSMAKREGRLSAGSRVLVLYASAGVSTAVSRFTYRP